MRLQSIARLERVVRVDDGSAPPLMLRVRTVHEYNRATNALQNEPGTLRWIAEQVRPGDVFYDVGANVGVFSLLAAHRVGVGGRVVAFEPHAATLAALLENVMLNGLGERVDVVSCALHQTTGHVPFLYSSLVAGSSLSQVDGRRVGSEHEPAPVARELKAVATGDDLIASGTIGAAHLIKIDVDGDEANVLAGMRELLRGPHRPRSVQVEVNPQARPDVLELMTTVGYEETGRHFTMAVERFVRQGADPARLGVNVVFEPVT